MQPKREKILYDLSEKLGIELFVLEVGRKVFVPEQSGQGAYVGTKPGGTLLWTQAALTDQAAPLTWTHTHPGMGAFFSTTDVSGAWRLRKTVTGEDVERSVKAVVLGKEGARYEVEINKEWTEANPEPKIMEWKPEPRPITRYESKWDRPSWTPSYRSGYTSAEYERQWFEMLRREGYTAYGREFEDETLYQEDLFQMRMREPGMAPPRGEEKIGLWFQLPTGTWMFKTFKALLSKKGRKMIDAMPDAQKAKVEARIEEWKEDEEREEMWKLVKLRHMLRQLDRLFGREVLQENLDAVGIIRLIRDGEEN